MGQKINPQSFRLGIIKDWPVRWFLPDKGGRSTYAKYLAEDEIIRKLIKEKLNLAGIASVEIERTINNLKVLIKAARPGFIIGRGGKGIEEVRNLRALRCPADCLGFGKAYAFQENDEEIHGADSPE